MISSSEFVTCGHPDRTADAIASLVLDRYLEQDYQTRAGIEVQLKDAFCTISGEVTSRANFSAYDIANFAKDAVNRIGYTREYKEKWGDDNSICGDDLIVTTHLSQQSPDIAQGVDQDGWGDQGIFHGLAVNNPMTNYLPRDMYLARKVGLALEKSGVGGLDIKTLVTTEDDKPIELIVAIPLIADADTRIVEDLVKGYVGADCRVVVNGTGRYVRHGSIGDCGTTGRKLAVDFYGGNCRIGGGTMWGKDPTKADVSLNVYARMRALRYMLDNRLPYVRCSISCCIGRKDIRVSYFDAHNEMYATETESRPASEIINELGLRHPGYFFRCRGGMFGYESVVNHVSI